MFIYKITNDANEKIYIGKTKNVRHRIAQHKSKAKQGAPGHFYNAVRQYGPEHFHLEIIEECSEENANAREQFWIKELNTTDREIGYNKTAGGDGGHNAWELNDHKEETSRKLSESNRGRVVSEETRRKLSEAHRGHTLSDDQRKKISDTLKEGFTSGRIQVVAPPHYDRTGEHHTDEAKKKMSVARKGKTYEEVYTYEYAEQKREEARQRWTGEGNPNYKDVPIDEVISLVESGMSGKEIAKLFGVRYQTIWSKLKKIGLSIADIQRGYACNAVAV